MTEDYPHLKKKTVVKMGKVLRHQYDFNNGYSIVAEKESGNKLENPFVGLWKMSLYRDGEMLITKDFPCSAAYFNDPTMDALLIRVALQQ